MQAHEKVVKALEIDRERSITNSIAKDALALCHNPREASKVARNDGDADDTVSGRQRQMSDIMDDILDLEDERTQKSFKSIVPKVIHVNRLLRLQPGVRAAEVAKTFATRFDRRRSNEFNDFLGKVLGETSLMSKTTELLFSLNLPLLGNCAREELMNLLVAAGSIALHRAKVCTTQICWEMYVEPLEARIAELSARYDTLKAQFSECRDSYLKEMALLRDHVRVRGDPEDGLPSLDVIYLLDPVQLLVPGEQKFLLHALREKLKMILEKNPKAEKCIDFGQFERLKELTEHHEIHELRVYLQKERNLVRKLQDEIGELRSKRSGDFGTGPVEGKAQRLITVLEDQVVDLQTRLVQERGEHQKAIQQMKHLEAERESLAQGLQESSCNGLLRERETKEMEEQLEHLQTTVRRAQRDAESNLALLAAKDDEIHNLKDIVESRDHELEALMKSLRRAPEESIQVKNEVFIVNMGSNERRAGASALATLGNSDKCSSPQAELTADSSPQAELTAEGEDVERVSDIEGNSRENSLPPSRSRAQTVVEVDMEEAMRARDTVLQRCRNLEAENEDLRETLRKHMENLVDMKAEAMLDDSNEIADEARALGCLGCDTSISSDLRVCPCGNVLAHDAAFCRKCGSKWQDGPTTKETETLITLATMHHDVEIKINEGMGKLQGTLEKKDVDDSKQAWVCQAMESQNELAKLQHDKNQLEARLLLARLKDASVAECLDDDTPCNCNCAQKVVALRQLLTRTRSLCTESTVKLQRASNESYNLSQTLDKIQKSLAVAARAAQSSHGKALDVSCTGGTEVVDTREAARDSEGEPEDTKVKTCLAAIEEARINSIFNRLYNSGESLEARSRRKAKRERLLQDTFRAVYQLDSGADKTVPVEPSPPCCSSEGKDEGVEVESGSTPMGLLVKPLLLADRPGPSPPAAIRTTTGRRPSASATATRVSPALNLSRRPSLQSSTSGRRPSATFKRALPPIERDLAGFGPNACGIRPSPTGKRAASVDLGSSHTR